MGSANRHTGILHFDSKYAIEEYIRTIDLPHTILRPVYFMYNYRGMQEMIDKGIIELPLSPQTTLQQLSEQDYGKIVSTVFADRDRFLGKEIDVASVDIPMTKLFIRISSLKPLKSFHVAVCEIKSLRRSDSRNLLVYWVF